MDKVAIVILNYNGKHFLEKFLPTVIKYSEGHPIYVIDNQSKDDSTSYLTANYPQIRQILLDNNYGYSGGYKSGLAQIRAEYFILLNSDIEVTHNWIRPVIDNMEADPTIAACQPKILSYHQRDHFEYAGAAGGFIDKLGYPFCRGRIYSTIEKDEGQYDDQIDIFWATGACLFIRSTAYEEVGGLDEGYFAHMEEIDLCWRLKTKGYRIVYIPESFIYHVGGGTLNKTNPYKTYLNFRNSLYTLYKNSATSELIWKIPLRWLLDLFAVAMFIVKGQIKDASAIFKANWVFLTHLSKLKPLRKKSLNLGPKRRHTEVFPGLSAVNYFLLRKRKFDKYNF
jgi:hypothetical protein